MSETELLCELKQFTGSSQLARLTRTVLLTEGVRYLAESAKCFWLFDLYASHLQTLDGEKDWFTCLKILRINRTATVTIEDGNEFALATQKIEDTDFPLQSYTFYGCWAGEFWVLMLPSEY